MGMYDYLQYSPIAHAIGMTLLHFIWQGLAAALVLGCALAILKRGSPQVRYLVSCLALLLMFLLPLSTFGYLCATSDLSTTGAVRASVLSYNNSLEYHGLVTRWAERYASAFSHPEPLFDPATLEMADHRAPVVDEIIALILD